jgi:hypothetical protein
MFEVGKTYRIKMSNGVEWISCEIVEIDPVRPNLIMVTGMSEGPDRTVVTILNTSSPAFVSAEPV